MKYKPFGENKNEMKYKLMDPFCIFYLRYVKDRDVLEEGFWQKSIKSHPVVVWRGFAFENVCLNHIKQIKAALGISGVSTNQSVWIKKPSDEKEGTQIDLIIERKDDIVNMCEMKYFSSEFASDKKYHDVLVKRQEYIEETAHRNMAVHSTLITTYGLKYNEYSGDFDNVITIEELFA